MTNSNISGKQNPLNTLVSLVLIGVIIATIFLDVIAITKFIVIPVNRTQIPVGRIENNKIYQNIYINLVDTLLLQTSEDFIDKAYKHPGFYNSIDIKHQLRCKHLNLDLLNIKALCIWWPSSKNIIEPIKNNCTLYYNNETNKLICY